MDVSIVPQVQKRDMKGTTRDDDMTEYHFLPSLASSRLMMIDIMFNDDQVDGRKSRKRSISREGNQQRYSRQYLTDVH